MSTLNYIYRVSFMVGRLQSNIFVSGGATCSSRTVIGGTCGVKLLISGVAKVGHTGAHAPPT